MSGYLPTYIAGIVLLLSCILEAGWDVWSKTPLHLITSAGIFLYFISDTPKTGFPLSGSPRFNLSPLRLFAFGLPSPRPGTSRIRPAVFLFSFLLFFLLSYLFSKIRFNAQLELHNWINYIALYYLFTQFSDAGRKRALNFLAPAVFIISAVAIYQTIFLKQSPPPSTMINANVLAGYIIMSLPCILYMYQQEGTKTKKYLLLVTLCVSAICLLFTRSGAAILALATAVLITKLSVKRGIILSFLIFLIFLGLKTLSPDAVNRLLWWESSVRIIRDHPLLGTGPGSFEFVYPLYKTAELSSVFAHNYFLQLAGDMGIPALIMLVLFLYKSIGRTENTYFKIAILSILIQNIFDYNLSIPANAILFWSLLGIAHPRAEHETDDTNRCNTCQNTATGNCTDTTRHTVAVPFLVVVLLITFLLISYSESVIRTYNATLHYSAGRNLSRAGIPDEAMLNGAMLNEAMLDEAEEKLKKSIRIMDNIWPAHAELAAVYLKKYKASRYRSYLYESEVSFENAKRHNPFLKPFLKQTWKK